MQSKGDIDPRNPPQSRVCSPSIIVPTLFWWLPQGRPGVPSEHPLLYGHFKRSRLSLGPGPVQYRAEQQRHSQPPPQTQLTTLLTHHRLSSLNATSSSPLVPFSSCINTRSYVGTYVRTRATFCTFLPISYMHACMLLSCFSIWKQTRPSTYLRYSLLLFPFPTSLLLSQGQRTTTRNQNLLSLFWRSSVPRNEEIIRFLPISSL